MSLCQTRGRAAEAGLLPLVQLLLSEGANVEGGPLVPLVAGVFWGCEWRLGQELWKVSTQDMAPHH